MSAGGARFLVRRLCTQESMPLEEARKILGVKQFASKKSIRIAFSRKAAMAGPKKDGSTERFKRIHMAFTLLLKARPEMIKLKEEMKNAKVKLEDQVPSPHYDDSSEDFDRLERPGIGNVEDTSYDDNDLSQKYDYDESDDAHEFNFSELEEGVPYDDHPDDSSHNAPSEQLEEGVPYVDDRGDYSHYALSEPDGETDAGVEQLEDYSSSELEVYDTLEDEAPDLHEYEFIRKASRAPHPNLEQIMNAEISPRCTLPCCNPELQEFMERFEEHRGQASDEGSVEHPEGGVEAASQMEGGSEDASLELTELGKDPRRRVSFKEKRMYAFLEDFFGEGRGTKKG